MRKLRRIALLLLLAACGSRTGLLTDSEGVGDDIDGSKDGTADGFDSNADAGDEDALPGLDVQPNPDVVRTDCPDADSTLVYVVSTNNNLYSFFPTDGTFKQIGKLTCPAAPGSNPFSMAVDRKGKAYVVFSPSGELFQVSTATGACIRTSYAPMQLSIATFGMGFSTDDLGPSETLYIAADKGLAPSQLGSIDLTSQKLSIIGEITPTTYLGELTGTGDGRLFSFYGKDPAIADTTNPMVVPTFIGELDKKTGKIVAETPLPFPQVAQDTGWAFGFWGGDFYIFTAPGGSTKVSRYRPADGTTTQVATIDDVIVGAGVSTCAPQ